MDSDEVLEKIGSYGLFQKRNTVLLGLIIFILSFQTVLMVFVGAEPAWKCAPQSSRCTANGSFTFGQDFYKARCEMNRSDWEFTTELTSIITEWDLVCGREVYASLAQSILFIGWIPGAFIIGRLSDRFGRKKVLFPAVACVAVISLASSFAHLLWLFLLLRGMVGFFQGGVYVTLYVFTTEFVGPKHRGMAGTLTWVFFTLSLMMLPGLAYGIRHWRTLSIVVSVPGVPLVILYRWIPESCRWLIVNSKPDEARKVYSLIAQMNGKELPAKDICLGQDRTEGSREAGILDLFRPRAQLQVTIILWFTWFVNSMVYYGVALSSGALGGSLYLNFFLASLVDIPSNVFAIWFMNWNRQLLCSMFYGRKRCMIVCLILASLFCVAVSAIPPVETKQGFTAGRIIFAILGKFCINTAFSTIYVYSSELLPTVIRNVGLGSMAVFDQTGASIAPFVVLLDKVNNVLPFGVMGAVALIAAVLCFTLPETLGRPTLETLSDINSGDAPPTRLEKELLTEDEEATGQSNCL